MRVRVKESRQEGSFNVISLNDYGCSPKSSLQVCHLSICLDEAKTSKGEEKVYFQKKRYFISFPQVNAKSHDGGKYSAGMIRLQGIKVFVTGKDDMRGNHLYFENESLNIFVVWKYDGNILSAQKSLLQFFNKLVVTFYKIKLFE